MVGQKLLQLLENHPWFDVVAMAASGKSCGKQYRDAVTWKMPTPIPPSIAETIIRPCSPEMPCSIVFSALDATIAGDIEEQFAHAGHIVISNAKNHRTDSDVPLLIPEVNACHLDIVERQHYSGMIITNPNCATIGLTMALKPLDDAFGVESVDVVTMQATSGAGAAGDDLDIDDNIIPHIDGEEEKIQEEPKKILGTYHEGIIIPSDIIINAQCNRVNVSDGHLACVSVKLKEKTTIEAIIEAWERFPQHLNTPTAPAKPVVYLHEKDHPQPKIHRTMENGMAVTIGRLKTSQTFDYSFVVLSHNTVRGAAGGAILSAEAIVNKIWHGSKFDGSGLHLCVSPKENAKTQA